jgi:transcriptional regulator with XRE-family HTH domain
MSVSRRRRADEQWECSPRGRSGNCGVSSADHHRTVPRIDGRPRSPRSLVTGRDRAAYLARRLGTGLKEQRMVSRISQRELAGRVGISQTELSRLERGQGAGTGLDVWAACAVAMGLQLAAFFERTPGADLPRDIEHLRRQNLVVATAQAGGWTAIPEATLDEGRWSRSIDVLLSRAVRREAAVVEIWDLLLDGGEAMRGLVARVEALRARLGPEWRVQGLLVVRGTHRNRALVRELRRLFAARYPAPSKDWLRALTDHNMPLPDAGGFAWTSVAGDRLTTARL